MYQPQYKSANGQPVYSQPRWWQRIFGYQPRYLQAPPATSTTGGSDDDSPAASKE